MTAPTLTRWTDTPEAARMSCPECEGIGTFAGVPERWDETPWDRATDCEICDGEGEVEATDAWLRDAAEVVGFFAYELGEAIAADLAERMRVAA